LTDNQYSYPLRLDQWRLDPPGTTRERKRGIEMRPSRFLSVLFAFFLIGALFLTPGPFQQLSFAATSYPAHTWSQQVSGTGKDLNGVAAVDVTSARAVGKSGTIISTNDGGDDWDGQRSGTTRHLRAVSAVDEENAWAVGHLGAILRTSDGGGHWKGQHSYTSLRFNGVSTADGLNAWAVGGNGLVSNNIMHTTDGGRHWHHQAGAWPHLRDLYGVAAVDANNAWAVGEKGTIWHTTDRGSHWKAQSSGTGNTLFAVAAVDANSALAVGAKGVILRTSNGGAHWDALSSGTGHDLHGVSAVDESAAWAVGDNGVILSTSDGGDDWVAEASGTANDLHAVSAVDAGTAWAVGDNGMILHGTPYPRIAGCSPDSIVQGDTVEVQIVGSNTHFENGVSVATVSGSGITVQSTSVTDPAHATANIIVDGAAPPGPRDVNVITGSETPVPLAGGLTVVEAPHYPPLLESLSPMSGPIGTLVTLGGQRFGDAQGDSEVTFNGTKAVTCASWSDTNIVCTVPEGATTGPVVVTTSSGTSNGIDFTVTSVVTPRVADCDPREVYQGDTIDLHIVGSDTHFDDGVSAASVSGAGVKVNSTTVTDPTHATANIIVDNAAPPGPRDVNVITGPETPEPLVGVFTILPRYKTPPDIHSISPVSGPTGTIVSIFGDRFGRVRGSSRVTFNGTPAECYVAWSDYEIVCIVPYGATTGLVKVTAPWGTSRGLQFEVTASTFYFAEGTCRPDFAPYICVQNPGEVNADVKITYMKGDGTVAGQELVVGAHTRSTVTVKDVLGEGEDSAHDFSAKVECAEGQQIIAERPMYFDYRGKWTGGSDVIGALAPAKDFFFAEGTTRDNVHDGAFDEWLCLQNPGDTSAEATVTYMLGTGKNVEKKYTVAKTSRRTVDVNLDLGAGQDVSASVESDEPVVAERPMYFDYHSMWTGGHDVIGALAPAPAFYFAEGTCRPEFDPYICVQNPNETGADVAITYMMGDGTVHEQALTVAPRSRATVTVKDFLGEGDDAAHDFSARVETTDGLRIVVERPMYFNYNGAWTGGHDVVGGLAPANSFYFAEGTCRPEFEPYLCIQNPGLANADVTITYMTGDGVEHEQKLTVPASSRSTVVVKDTLGVGDDAAHDFSARVECTNGMDIVCERPMYFNYKGVWTGGHDVVGFIP